MWSILLIETNLFIEQMYILIKIKPPDSNIESTEITSGGISHSSNQYGSDSFYGKNALEWS